MITVEKFWHSNSDHVTEISTYSVNIKNQTMGCGLPCEQEESYPGEQISNSSEDEFQVLSIGRYQMTVDNPKDMENPWR